MNTNVVGSRIQINKVSKDIKQNTVNILEKPGEKSFDFHFF